MNNKFISVYNSFLHANYKRIVFSFLVISCISIYFATKLKFESNFESLLPKTFPSVRTLDEVTEEFGGTGYLVAVIKSQNPAASKKFASDFVSVIEKLPEVRYVSWRQPKKFFEDRKLLFIELKDLKEIRRRINKKIEFEKNKANPFFVDLTGEDYKLDLSDIEKKYSQKEVFREYYESPDGKELLLLIKPDGLAGDLKFSRRLERKVLNAFERLKPASYAPDLTLELTGRYKKQIDLNDQLMSDIRFTVFGSLFLASLILFFFFRQVRGALLVGIPLLAGIFITLAFAWLKFGYLNIITGFLFSILLGIGMDYGIVFYSRYMEERIKGVDSQHAMLKSFEGVGVSILVAAFTTMASFFSLLIAEFKGFSQFGAIAGVGVLINLFVFLTLHPSLIILLEKIKEPVYKPAFSFFLKIPRLNAHIPALIITLVIVSYAVLNFSKISFEYDFNSVQGSNIPSFLLDKRVNEIIGTSLTPDIVMTDSLRETAEVSQLLSEKEQNPDSTIDSHASVLTFMPEDQEERIKELKKIKLILEDPALKALDKKQKDKLEEIKKLLSPSAITKDNLPGEISRMFYGKSGKMAVYIFPKINLSDVLLVRKASDEIRDLKLKERTLHPVSESVIFSEILRMIENDGKTIMLVSFLCVLLPVLIAYKSIKVTILIGLNVLISLIFLLAGMIFFSMKLNFFNVLMLPLIFGLSIDYGEYLFSRYKQEGAGSAYFTITHSGPAVFMSAFTTMLGFATLLFANHMGLKTIGQISVMGIFFAFLSSLVFLLSFLVLLERLDGEK